MPPPRVERVELRVVRLALRRPFRAAHGTTSTRDVLLVRALGPDGEGWGECAADTTPGYWHETVDSAWEALWSIDLATGTIATPRAPMAQAAAEMAWLDLALRTAGRPLAAHLGATRAAIDATVTCGLDDDPAELLAGGYRSVKIKAGPGLRPDVHLTGVAVQVDANGTLDPTLDAPWLEELDAAGVVAVEQPFPTDDLAAHRALRERVRMLVCLDESASSLDAARAAVAAGAAGALCVKPSRLGGLARAVAVHDLCTAHGVAAKVGGMLETGIGRAAALALAGLPGFTLPADLSAADRYWENDIVAEPARLDADGRITVPTGPGLGVEVDVAAVEAATVRRATIEP